MDVLQNIDVGLVVLDEEFNVQLWNSFMQNHSARSPSDVLGKKYSNYSPSYQKPGSAARCSQFRYCAIPLLPPGSSALFIPL